MLSFFIGRLFYSLQVLIPMHYCSKDLILCLACDENVFAINNLTCCGNFCFGSNITIPSGRVIILDRPTLIEGGQLQIQTGAALIAAASLNVYGSTLIQGNLTLLNTSVTIFYGNSPSSFP